MWASRKSFEETSKISNVFTAMFPHLAKALVLFNSDISASIIHTNMGHAGLDHFPILYVQKNAYHVTFVLIMLV